MSSPRHPYSSWIKQVFERSAATYGQVGPPWFEYFGRSLADQAGVDGAERLLDLACGRGSSLIPAHGRLGTDGLAVGVDLAAEMLQILKADRSLTADQRLNLVQMDALSLGFADEVFDVVQCGLALFFLPDLAQGLREVLRVLRHGGRFVFSTFGERDVRWAPFGEIARAYEDRVDDLPDVELQDLDKAEEVIEILEKAGFEDVQVVSITRDFYFSDAEEWWQTMWSHGGRGYLERMDSTVRAEFQVQVFEFLEKIKEEQGIPNRLDVMITRALKPGK